MSTSILITNNKKIQTEAGEGGKTVLEVGTLQVGNEGTVLHSDGSTLAVDVTVFRAYR